MPNTVQVTCFTDLRDSSELARDLGNEAYAREISWHNRVTRALVERVGGTYNKDMGDGHLLTFNHIEGALKFALQFQEYYKARPALERRELQLKIGLCLGVVQSEGQDVLGSDVNKSSRIQGQAQPTTVLVNGAFIAAVEQIWGQTKPTSYFTSVGEKELRGCDPLLQELYSFDWQKYGADTSNEGLAGAIYEHFQQTNIEASLLSVDDFANPGTIIWPVVPRDFATAIHRGQTEMVRLLALLGWQVKLLIADCGARNNYERSYSEAFCSKLQGYLATRNVKVTEKFFLSDFFEPNHRDYPRMQSLFRTIASNLTLQDLLNINNKEYTDDVKAEIRESTTLDCLRPALSLAAVSHLVENETQKSVVISGQDESIVWQRAYDIPTTQGKIGVLMNPVLKEDATHTGRQRNAWPSWPSKQALVRAMDHTNLAWWAFRLHAYLPAFPEQAVQIGEAIVKPTEWNNELTIPEGLDRNALADHVWQRLDPAL